MRNLLLSTGDNDMNRDFYNLVLLIVCIIALLAIVLTGHDNSPLVTSIFAGGAGGSGARLFASISHAVFGDSTDTPPKQGGYATLPYALLLLIATSIVGAMFLLSGCTSLAGKSDPVATSCAAASAAIKTVTTARANGLLNAKEIAAVDTAIAAVQPVCTAPTEPPPTAAAITAFNSAVLQLEAAATAHAH